MTLPIVLLLAVLTVFGILHLISQSIHKKMTVERTDKWDYGTFEVFKREFNKHSWETDSYFHNSLFDRKNNSKIHASIIKFNNKGMVLSGMDYIRFLIFMSKHLKNGPNKNVKDLWDDKTPEGVK